METIALDRDYLEKLAQSNLSADAGTTQFCYSYVDALDFLDSLNPNRQALDSLVCWKTVKGNLEKEISCFLELTLYWNNAETIALARDVVLFASPGLISVYQFGVIERSLVYESRRRELSYPAW